MRVLGQDIPSGKNPGFTRYGVWGDAEKGYGVIGLNVNGIGVFGESGMVGVTEGIEAVGVEGDSLTGTGVIGFGLFDSPDTIGVYGQGKRTGVMGRNYDDGTAIDGYGTKLGVLGRTQDGIGIHGSADGAGTGVRAESANGIALIADGKGSGPASGVGIQAAGSQAAVVASNPGAGTAATLAGTVLAGQFSGNVVVTGGIIADSVVAIRTKMFEIDHPLDPERRILRHATVESAERKNVYDGVAVLDQAGECVVALPPWFEALNGDFRYQLTCLGAHAPVYIGEEICDQRFRIAGGVPGLKVSWMVTGVRRDPSALAHPLRIEEDKAAAEEGLLLDPAAYGLPADRGIWSHRQPPVAATVPAAPDLPPAEPPASLREHLRRRREEA